MTELRERSVAALLSECLIDLGVIGVWGGTLPGLVHRGRHADDLDRLFADAEGRLGPGPGAALVADGRTLHISTKPGGDRYRFTVLEVGELPEAVALWHMHGFPATYEIELGLDLEAPAPAELGPVPMGADRTVPVLDTSLADEDVVIVAGPGVVRSNAIASLETTAARAAAGVLNTWGAKGVFRWDDPRHHGTFGLQARDLELSGVTEAGMVIATGIDPLELPPGGLGDALVLEVPPRQLTALVHHWPDPTRAIPSPPPLHQNLSLALAPLYGSEAVPLTPPRAAADLAETCPVGGVVVADPGEAGLWVARTFPTRAPESVLVPATVAHGFAAAASYVGHRLGRKALGVTSAPVDDVTPRVLELARAERADLALVVWDEAAEPLATAGDHPVALDELWRTTGVRVLSVPVDLDQLTVLIDVAGPITAFAG